MRRYLFLIFILLWIQCRNHSTSPGITDKDQVISSAKKMLQDYYDDIRANGLLAEIKWLDSSSSFFWVPPGYGGPILFDSVAKVIRRNALSIRKIDERWENLQIQPLTADFVSYTGRINSTVIDSAGHSTTNRFLETGILIKKEDGWKLLSGQTGMLPESGQYP
jgi:hypothetical protein